MFWTKKKEKVIVNIKILDISEPVVEIVRLLKDPSRFNFSLVGKKHLSLYDKITGYDLFVSYDKDLDFYWSSGKWLTDDEIKYLYTTIESVFDPLKTSRDRVKKLYNIE